LGKDTKQYLKDNPEVAKELTAAMEAGQNAKVEDLLGGLPGQDALIDAGEKIAEIISKSNFRINKKLNYLIK